MPRPWTKKNPLMSLWLSAANRWAALAQREATATMKRAATKPAKPRRGKLRRS